MTDYAGNAGTSTVGATGPGDYGDGSVDGVVVHQGTCIISLASVRDGASNTILVGEKHLNLSFCSTEPEPDDNDGYVGGFEDDTVRWGDYGPNGSGHLPPAPDDFGPLETTANIIPQIYRFGSSHPAGANSSSATARSRSSTSPSIPKFSGGRRRGMTTCRSIRRSSSADF